ncbi:MAG: glycosyltransferase family 2 protein [Alcanivorax sp.]|nr:glycosyltransferase family 2 protein [Alcanivorax sp.]
METISVVVPAKNEARTIASVVKEASSQSGVIEVIVIDDGSDDDTAGLAASSGAKVISHPISLGNGAAVKRGAREATGELIVFMDGDGQHAAADIPKLKDAMTGYDMAVGARSSSGQTNFWRRGANYIYNVFSSFVTGHKIKDLTSGFRIVRAVKFKELLYLLPNGFSYPTTSTMAFFRSGYPVNYVYVDVAKRLGKSHIRPIKDGVRFLLIIFKVATLYSPLKVFVPIAAISFLLGLGRYLYTYIEMGQFTNMSALLMVTAVQIFLIGLVSEQITTLMYKEK